jgi:BirA family transcriptional regulator, biotin operon repressor / biotin---[acetyl-CoA-carboxylase] ligase
MSGIASGAVSNTPDRPPLRADELRAAYPLLDVVAETGSTNSDLASAARAGAAHGTVLVAEYQSAGRGRTTRAWVSPPRAGLSFSVLLRPDGVPAPRLGWAPLLAGVALAAAVHDTTGVETTLKWPNDLLVDGRKCAGILAEAHNGAVVVGIGLNVSQQKHELPPGVDATSLALEGATSTDREALLLAILRALLDAERSWRRHRGDPMESGLHRAYTGACATLGKRVAVLLPSGATLTGLARGIDVDGRLLVRDGAGDEHAVSAGDIAHVRPAG